MARALAFALALPPGCLPALRLGADAMTLNLNVLACLMCGSSPHAEVEVIIIVYNKVENKMTSPVTWIVIRC